MNDTTAMTACYLGNKNSSGEDVKVRLWEQARSQSVQWAERVVDTYERNFSSLVNSSSSSSAIFSVCLPAISMEAALRAVAIVNCIEQER
jgi:hypothetical protein